MDAERATSELRHLDELLGRARLRMDAHAFHYVHWGWIVLVWFPLETWLAATGRDAAAPWVRGASVALGMALSVGRELRLRGSARVAGEDRHFTRQIVGIVYGSIAVGTLLSALGPPQGLFDETAIPIVWGLVYANIAWVTGIVYRREFLYGAALMLAGVVVAIVFREKAGYVLGPAMGLGMIVPGQIAERDARRQLTAGGALEP